MPINKSYIHSIFDNADPDKLDQTLSVLENILNSLIGYSKADMILIYRVALLDFKPIIVATKTNENELDEITIQRIFESTNTCLKKTDDFIIKDFEIDDTNTVVETDLAYVASFNNHDSSPIKIFGFWEKEIKQLDESTVQDIKTLLKASIYILNTLNEKSESYQVINGVNKLAELFDIPDGEMSLEELTGHITDFIMGVIPEYDYALFTSRGRSELKLLTSSGKAVSDPVFTIPMVNLLSEWETDASPALSGNKWHDWTDRIEHKFNKLLVTSLYYENDASIFLTACQKKDKISSIDSEELLNVFAIFAGIIVKAHVFIKNLTRANRRLRKATTQLADVESQAALTDMTSGLAHDFNNVIGGIIGRLQLLQLQTKDDKMKKSLSKIEQLALDGASTVKRIQEFSTKTKSKDLKPVEIISTINNYIMQDDRVWAKLAAERNINISFDSDTDEAFILGSEDDILTVLDKIIENGVEHSYDDTEIQLSLSESNKYYTIDITNIGRKISKDIRKKIFYPFFTTKSTYGAGLGLAIVHGIVVRHGGRIRVESNRKNSTVFKVSFLKPEKIDEDSEVSQSEKINSNLTILVVDDDEQIREVLIDMLSIDGHNVTACQDGNSALDKINDQDYDVMITDLGMPGMSGLELAGVVHENKPEMPIAMITGWGTQINHDEVSRVGIKAVLSKPFHLKEIKTMISELISA
jgi:signal transduction histidine kinase/CheY-like chemotaxis protein